MNNAISLEEFKQMDEYNSFMEQNPSNGILKIQVFSATQSIPIANVNIRITKQIGNNNVIFFEGKTDESGIIDNILLPAPNGEYNAETYEIPGNTSYMVTAVSNNFNEVKQKEVGMFGDIKVIQVFRIAPTNGEANE